MVKFKSTIRANPILVAAIAVIFALSVTAWAAVTNMGSLTLSGDLVVDDDVTIADDLTVTDDVSADAFVAGSDTLPPYSIASFYLGDTVLGMDADAGAFVGIFDPHTAITVVGMDFYGNSILAADTVGPGSPEIFFRNEGGGIYSDTLTVTRGVVLWPLQSTFRWNIAADSACTLFVRDDGTDATGQTFTGGVLHLKFVDQ